MNELALVDRLRTMKGVSGIGDDCAVFRPKANEDLLLKTDQLIEGIHFAKAMRPEIIGGRALARALSDIAAGAAVRSVAWLRWLFREPSPSAGSCHSFAGY